MGSRTRPQTLLRLWIGISHASNVSMPTSATAFQDPDPNVRTSAASTGSLSQSSSSRQAAHVMKRVRIFLLGACATEIILIVPNLLAEVYLRSGAPLLAVRSVLTLSRL